MRKVFIISVLLLQSVYLQAQGMNRKGLAEKYYSMLDFASATPIYNELARKALKQDRKGREANWDAVRRAAQANFYMRNYEKAAGWYRELMKGNALQAEDYMRYFETLQYLGAYAEADHYLDVLEKSGYPSEQVQEYKKNAAYYVYLKKDSALSDIYEMPFNKGLGDFSPAFYDNGLVFASNRRNPTLSSNYSWDNRAFLNLYYSAAKEGSYERKARLLRRSFKTRNHDGPVFYSRDGHTAYITRNRTENDLPKGAVTGLGIYIAYKGKNGKWGRAQPFAYNSTTYSTGHASLSADEKTLFFTSDMPGGKGGTDIWMSSLSEGVWGEPQNVEAVNSSGDEMFPFQAPDGTLFFASDGYVGLGGLDIFEARTVNSAFANPVNLGYPVNSNGDDFGLITRDGKQVWFSSDRKDFYDRVYGGHISRVHLSVRGIVKEGSARRPAADARVIVYNKTLQDSLVLTTDSSGHFSAELNRDCDYEILVDKKNFTLVSPVQVSTRNQASDKTYEPALELNTNPTVLKLQMQNSETGIAPGRGAIWLRDAGKMKKYRLELDPEGVVQVPEELTGIAEECPYEWHGYITPEISGYTPAEKEVTVQVTCDELYGTVTRVVGVDRIREGTTLTLDDVFYDYGKATLRPESMVSLDKAYTFLEQNPNIRVQLASHTDSRGSDSYNMSLSQRRAQSCVDYLVKVKGIPPARIVAKGYGETMPVNKCKNGVPCSEEEHQANRRTEIRVLKVQ